MPQKSHNDKEQNRSLAAANSPHYQQPSIVSAIPPPFQLTAEPIEFKKEDDEKEKALQKKKNSSFADDGAPESPADSNPSSPSSNSNTAPRQNFLVSLQRKAREQSLQLKQEKKEAPKENILTTLQRKHNEETKEVNQQKKNNTGHADDGTPTAPPANPNGNGNNNRNEHILTTLQRKHNAYHAPAKAVTPFQLKYNKADIPQPKQFKKFNPFQRKEAPGNLPQETQAQGKGQLPTEVQGKMENTLGQDFSNVNIHKDSQQAKDANALAYAQGNDVHFAPGQFQPETQKGQELIGHELTHVKQQREGRVKPTKMLGKGMPVNDDPALEKEADDLGKKATEGTAPQNSVKQNSLASTTENAIQKKVTAGATAPLSNTATVNSSRTAVDDAGQDTDVALVPPITLFGQTLNIDVSGVSNSQSMPLDLDILPNCKATRLEVSFNEGAFESARLFVEHKSLAEAEMILEIDATGSIHATLSIETTVLGLPTTINAQVTESGFSGEIQLEIPENYPLSEEISAKGGLISFNLNSDGTSVFSGHIEAKSNDGFAAGIAFLEIDSSTSVWSGTVKLYSIQEKEIIVAPGARLILPAGIELNMAFNSEGETVVNGTAHVTTEVSLAADGGLQAAGTADLTLRFGTDGLSIAPSAIRLAVSGGLSEPDLSEVLAEYHLTNQVDAGALITLNFDDTGLSSVELEATFGVSNQERRIGRISFAGQAQLNPFAFMGILHLTTQAEFDLIAGAKFITSLMPGSQLWLSVDQNGVSNVDASVGLEFSDTEAAIATLTLIGMRPRGQALSLSAQIDLLRRLELSTVEENGFAVAILPTTGLGATLSDGALTGINGALAMEMGDENGPLLAGSIEGDIAITETDFALESGEATANLLRDLSIEMGSAVVTIAHSTSVEAAFEGGQLTKIGGNLVVMYTDGNTNLAITASVDYDPQNSIIRSLDAELATDTEFKLFDDQLTISELGGGLSIRNNEVISLGGHARLEAQLGDFHLAGEADLIWKNEGGDDVFVGSGFLEFAWQQDEEGHRFITGRVDATIDGDEFSLFGSVEMGLMEGLTGTASVAMDQEMDPVISASLTYGTTLMEASELWAMEFGFGITIPIVLPIFNIEAGILFGIAINTRPLMVFGTAGIQDWRPKSDDIPTFSAELRASWGIDIEAQAMAYVGLLIGFDFLGVSGGVRAGVGLTVPIELSPYISLFGSDEGIWGEMGLDLSIDPILRLLIEAYLKWNVLSIWDGEKSWPLLEQDLAEMGNIDWNGSFAFGDKQESTGQVQAQKETAEPQGASIPTPENLNKDSSLGIGNKENEPESEAGLTGLTDGLSVPSSQEGEEQDTGGLGEKFGQIGMYANGIAAAGDLINIIADGFQALIKGGPVGLIIWLIFKKPSKSVIQEKQAILEEFRQELGDTLKPESLISRALAVLSGEYNFWDLFDSSKPYRDMVDQGLHEEAPIDERAKICDGMIKGWTAGNDEAKLIRVLVYTHDNDGLAAVREMVDKSGGPGKWRDQYESFLWQDRSERKTLNRIFDAAYGSNNSNSDGMATFTAEPGATIDRSQRTNEELAKEAFGHESYAIYISAMSSNTPGGNIVNIPTWDQAEELARTQTNSTRLQAGSNIDYAHRFEHFDFLAEVVYGNIELAWRIQEHNPHAEVTDFEISILGLTFYFTYMKEGVQLTLPSVGELGPPEIQISPIPITGTDLTLRVDHDGESPPVMMVGPPDQLVSELAEQAMLTEDGVDAGQQLADLAAFTDITTETEARNSAATAANLIEFLYSSNVLGQNNDESGTTPIEEAVPGDLVQLGSATLAYVAKQVYGHEGRAAWIQAYRNQAPVAQSMPVSAAAKTTSTSSRQSTGSSSGSRSSAKSNGPTNSPIGPNTRFRLPQWSQMDGLDPLPAATRGIAPKTVITIIDGDSWSDLAIKAYGDWSYAVKLSDYEANTGKTLTAGTLITLPTKSDLNATGPIAVAEQEVDKIPMDGAETDEPASDRIFEPGTEIVIEAGDTWSALALAAYDDFELFVKLSNHPANSAVKTLPAGAKVYLPTLAELEEIPEFGLGLSPTGKPLLTEMVRIPTNNELHHVWAENVAETGAEENAVWMMASTPEALTVLIPQWKQEFAGNALILGAVTKVETILGAEVVSDSVKEREGDVRQIAEATEQEEDTQDTGGTVGIGGTNAFADVSKVTNLLHDAKILSAAKYQEDIGRINAFNSDGIPIVHFGNTITAIEDFQNNFICTEATGQIKVGDEAYNTLKEIQDEACLIEEKTNAGSAGNSEESVFARIWDDPKAFYNNLGEAMEGGVQRYLENFDPLEKLTEWISQETGIDFPTDWDPAKLIETLLERLGLSLESFENRIIAEIGQENYDLISQSLGYVQTLMNDGFYAMLDEIGGDMVNGIIEIKDNFLNTMQSWLFEQLIEKGTIELGKMLTPVSGIISTVMKIATVVEFIYDKINDLSQLYETIKSSINEILEKRLDSAMSMVENTLNSATMLAINFFMRLIRLNSVTAKVNEFLDGIETKISSLVDRAFNWLFDTIAPLLSQYFQWPEKEISYNGENHTLQVDEINGRHYLFMHSTPTNIVDFVSGYRTNNPTMSPAKAALCNRILVADTEISGVIVKIENEADPAKKKELNVELYNKLVALGKLINKLLDKNAGVFSRAKYKYKLEGTTGRYGGMVSAKSDDFDKDHQPQDAVLKALMFKPYFRGTGLGRYNKNSGYAIALHKFRHAQSRTYKTSGGQTKAAFLARVTAIENANQNPTIIRNLVIELLKDEVNQDADTILNRVVGVGHDNPIWDDLHAYVARGSNEKIELVDQIKDQIRAGEAHMKNQDFDRFK